MDILLDRMRNFREYVEAERLTALGHEAGKAIGNTRWVIRNGNWKEIRVDAEDEIPEGNG